jgi:hypothetical protein
VTAKHTSRSTGHGSPPHLMIPSPRPSPPICRAAGRKGGWVGVGVGGGKQRTRKQASAVLSTCNKWCDWTQGHSTGAAGRQLWACGHGQAWAAHLGYDDRGQPQACCCSQSIGAVASTLHLHPPPPPGGVHISTLPAREGRGGSMQQSWQGPPPAGLYAASGRVWGRLQWMPGNLPHSCHIRPP